LGCPIADKSSIWTRKPQNELFGAGLYINSSELGARELAVGHWILRIREEEESGDQESQANQTEERPAGNQGHLRLLRQANLQDWQAEVGSLSRSFLF
jgi:hypothetical protein